MSQHQIKTERKEENVRNLVGLVCKGFVDRKHGLIRM